jgi:hypothetical protein
MMFVVLKGFHASMPGEVSYTTVAIGAPISPNFTTTSVVLVAATEKEAVTALLDVPVAA